MKRMIIMWLVCSLTTTLAIAQNFMYVNSDAAYLRQFPLDTSKGLIILHAPTRVEVQPITDRDFKDKPEITNNWVIGRLMVTSGTQFSGESFSGYIQKKDLVGSLAEVTAPGVDTTQTLLYTKITTGDSLVAPKISYRSSSRGGCYFINSSGQREYVSAENCMPKTTPTQLECPVDVMRKPENE